MGRLVVSEIQRIFKSRRNQLLLLFYIILILFSCVFRFKVPQGSYDGINYNVNLNNLNFSLFVFYEIRLELFYVILPILFIGSINYEQSIGAFRMYMIRPYKKYELLISKCIALALTAFIFIIIGFLISAVFGCLFMPKVSTVKFYGISSGFSPAQAFIYTVVFAIIQFVISLCVLGLTYLIGLIIDNSVISLLAVMALMVVLGFHTKLFKFLDYTTVYGFHILAGTANAGFYAILAATIIVTFLISAVLWQKKDYIY